MDNQKRTENAIDRAEAMTKMLAGNVKSDEEDIYIKVSAVVQLLRELSSVNQQELKTDRDCISRDYLLSIANKDGAYGYVSAHDIINVPCYNPQEPKTGHWIKRDGYWECSECHAERAYGNEYCPDCGSHNGDIAKPYKEGEVEE